MVLGFLQSAKIKNNTKIVCEGEWEGDGAVLYGISITLIAQQWFFCVIPGRLFCSSHCSGVFPLPLQSWRWITLLLHMHEIGLLLLIEQQRRACEMCHFQTISYYQGVWVHISCAVGWENKGKMFCQTYWRTLCKVHYTLFQWVCSRLLHLSLPFFFSLAILSFFAFFIYVFLVLLRFTGESGLVPVRGAETST